MDELMGEIPMELRERFAEIADLIDEFCDEHLNDEYKEICRKMTVALCQADSPVARGKPQSWACGIVYSAGWVNFLTDPTQDMYMRSEDIAKGFGVSMATMQAKSRTIRQSLGLMPFQPEYSLSSMADENPLIWMAEVNGLVVDLRHAPRIWQEKAYRQGMIPYIPADRKRRVKK
jgi:hypothetical protein